MKIVHLQQTVTFAELKTKHPYVIGRYLLRLLKNIPTDSVLYYNGSEGLHYAILYSQYAPTIEKAIEDMAADNNETIDVVEDDVNNWYYRVPYSEALDSVMSDVTYYSPVK